MKSWLESLGRAVSVGLLMTTAAQAQDIYDIIDSFRAGEFSINGPSLERFALEWAALAGMEMGIGERQQPNQYRVLRDPDQEMLQSVLSAFDEDDEVTGYLIEQETVSAFNRTNDWAIPER